MPSLLTCKSEYRKALERELAMHDFLVQKSGQSWFLVETGLETVCKKIQLNDLCFMQAILANPARITVQSVNSFALKLDELFCSSIKDRFIANPIPVLFFASESERLAHRLKTVERSWRQRISRKMPRVGKLLQQRLAPAFTYTEGLFVYYAELADAFSARSAFIGCQRMAMDNKAPSRSYLKIEEAYCLLGCQPRPGDSVVDLGAAPGGWAYSCLKRGAKVTAVDNAKLSVSLNAYANLKHLKQDAFIFTRDNRRIADWLFCDILAQPDMILELLAKWVQAKLCRRFIVNLKFGKTDPIALLKKIRDPGYGLAGNCSLLKTRQLYHDRQEFTLAGCVLR